MSLNNLNSDLKVGDLLLLDWDGPSSARIKEDLGDSFIIERTSGDPDRFRVTKDELTSALGFSRVTNKQVDESFPIDFDDDDRVRPLPLYTHVSAYGVTREYGGPEEGGWWYDNYDLICSIPIKSDEQAETVKKFLEENLSHLNEGNLNSVLGGIEVRVLIEEVRAQFETKGRPRYE